jgi:hypothetical protein
MIGEVMDVKIKMADKPGDFSSVNYNFNKNVLTFFNL